MPQPMLLAVGVPRKPAKGRDEVTNIPVWKFDAVRAAVLDAVASAGDEGLVFKNLPDAVRRWLPTDSLNKLGSLGWHVTTMKLEMKVAGEIRRLEGQ